MGIIVSVLSGYFIRRKTNTGDSSARLKCTNFTFGWQCFVISKKTFSNSKFIYFLHCVIIVLISSLFCNC